MIDKLPKRSDIIYKEIEKFEDYEYTNCIAYEMMIRNKEFLKDSDEVFSFVPIFIKDGYIYENKNYNHQKLYELITKYSKKWGIDEDSLLNYNDYKINKMSMGYSVFYKSEDNIFFEAEIDKTAKLNKNDNIENFVNLTFQRPKIRLQYSRIINLDLNLNLPIDELIAFISKIKDDYDKNILTIKSPLELLGESLNKVNNKKINKKLIADKFFIYDYVKIRQEEIKINNEILYKEYEEAKQIINKNHYLNSKDRKIQLKELKKEFEENVNSRIEELFADIEDFTPATVKRYYYDIKPFIDDCKYKELITGIKL